MSGKQPTHPKEAGSERMIFSLPKALVSELEEYARVLRNGNKSGFVADAIRSYIDHYRKRRHTALLRDAYAASAEASRAIAQEWEPLDDETWARLDELERRPKNKQTNRSCDPPAHFDLCKYRCVPACRLVLLL